MAAGSKMFGADADALEAAAAALSAAADELDGSAQSLSSSLGALQWLGTVAVRFTDLWHSQHSAKLTRTSGYLRENADRLRFQASEQRSASLAGSGALAFGPAGRAGRLPAPFPGGLENQTPQPPCSRVVSFDGLMGRGQALGAGEIEILKVSDDPARFIVNLRGIEFKTEDPWEQDHLQDLHGASDARLTGGDRYAERVKLEMQRAGIPAGAEVMLVGHSAGAIAAMNIARDTGFNQPGNPSSAGDYHVRVTHVVAAGAGLRDWVNDPPEGTNVLMAINRNDRVAQGIQVGDFGIPKLPSTLSALSALGDAAINDVFDITDPKTSGDGGRLVMEFSANAGPPLFHDFDNYERGFATADAAANRWMDSAAQTYFKGGGQMQVVRIAVPDQVSYGAPQ